MGCEGRAAEDPRSVVEMKLHPPIEPASHEPTLAAWLKQIASLPATGFVPIHMDDPRCVEIRAQSSAWSSNFWVPALDPHRSSTPPAWQFHAAADESDMDMIRTRYESAEREILYIETFNFIAVGVGYRSEVFGRQALSRLELLIRSEPGPASLRFAMPPSMAARETPYRLTTAKAQPVRALTGRYDRADLIVAEDAAWIIVFKVVEQLIGLRPDAGWFDADLRDLVRSEERKQATIGEL